MSCIVYEYTSTLFFIFSYIYTDFYIVYIYWSPFHLKSNFIRLLLWIESHCETIENWIKEIWALFGEWGGKDGSGLEVLIVFRLLEILAWKIWIDST